MTDLKRELLDDIKRNTLLFTRTAGALLERKKLESHACTSEESIALLVEAIGDEGSKFLTEELHFDVRVIEDESGNVTFVFELEPEVAAAFYN